MRDYFASAAAWAETVTVREAGAEKTAKAFIQPLSSVTPDYEKQPTAMGLRDDRRYLIIAEPGAISGDGDVEISCGGKVYELLRCEMLGGSHWEGVLKLKGGNGDA